MRHFTDGSFNYSNEPFPAFRSNLVFGRNKRASEFLPTKVGVDEEGLLPEGKFRVIKTKAKGTLLVVPGEEYSNRIVAMVGENSGFRGYVSLHDDTTANVLKECSAGNATEARIEVIALMSPGEAIVFHSTGRRTNSITVFAFNGIDVQMTIYELAEYEAQKELDEAGESL